MPGAGAPRAVTDAACTDRRRLRALRTAALVDYAGRIRPGDGTGARVGKAGAGAQAISMCPMLNVAAPAVPGGPVAAVDVLTGRIGIRSVQERSTALPDDGDSPVVAGAEGAHRATSLLWTGQDTVPSDSIHGSPAACACAR